MNSSQLQSDNILKKRNRYEYYVQYAKNHSAQLRINQKKSYYKNRERILERKRNYREGLSINNPEQFRFRKEYLKEYHSQPEQLEKNKIRGRNRISFKTERVMLESNPRQGMCSNCGKQNVRTEMHHIEYTKGEPLAETVELCGTCHSMTKSKKRRKRTSK